MRNYEIVGFLKLFLLQQGFFQMLIYNSGYSRKSYYVIFSNKRNECCYIEGKYMYVPILSLDRVQRTLPFNDIIFWTLIESNDV